MGNATGGGWIPGETPDYPSGHAAEVQDKFALWDAYGAALEDGLAPDPDAVRRAMNSELGPAARSEMIAESSESSSGTGEGFGEIEYEERPPECIPGRTCPEAPRVALVLKVPHREQINGYFCGPATGVMIANYLERHRSAYNRIELSQPHMGGDAHMQTDRFGRTGFDTNNWTEGLNRWMRGTTTGYYTQVAKPTPTRFRSALRYDIDDRHPFGVGTVELTSVEPYNNHDNSRIDVGHWLVAYGYSQNLDKVHFKDPATSVWAGTRPDFIKSTNSFVNTYVSDVGNGISA